jgi:hypothetical protein
LDGALIGLDAVDSATRSRLLTDAVCDMALGRDLSPTPRVGLRVLSSVGRRHRARRVELTRDAVALERQGLTPAEIDAALGSLWSAAAPTAGECAALLDSWAPESVPAALARFRVLAGLPSRAFAAAHGELDAPDVVRLAERVVATLSENDEPSLCADAAVVTGYAALAHAADVRAMARSQDRDAAAPASPELIEAAFVEAAKRLAARPPEFRESLMIALTESARARLTDRWDRKPERRVLDRRRLFRRRGG